MIKTGYELNCLVCHKSFYAAMWRLKTNNTKYCSSKCRGSQAYTWTKLKSFKKGHIPWNKGKELTQFRKKDNKRNERYRLMKQIEYILWRTAVFTRDNYTCQICNQYGGKLEADHIKAWSLYPELRYAIDNGRTLCIPCHRQTDTWGRKVFNFRKEVA